MYSLFSKMKCEPSLWSIINCCKLTIYDFTGLNIYLLNLNLANPGSTKPIFCKYERKCLNVVCLGPFLKDRKFQFCPAAANKFCGSGNHLI